MTMENVSFNLKELLDHFYEIGEKRWGDILHVEELEEKFCSIKQGKEDLSKRHLKLLGEDWRFLNWWKMPEISDKDLKPLKGKLINLMPQSKLIIGDLFGLLKNIEIVSCLLRFVDPINYAIFSPPVENLLNVRGTNPIEKYLNYLKDLSELKSGYGFERIAHVDMALWTLAFIINYPDLQHNPLFDKIYENYCNSTNLVKKIMARNSLLEIADEAPLFKADLLLESDPRLAGILAGIELELSVKRLCDEHNIKLKVRQKPRDKWLSMSDLLEELRFKKVITKEESNELNDWWDLRCELVHREKYYYKKEDISGMINSLLEISTRYKK